MGLSGLLGGQYSTWEWAEDEFRCVTKGPSLRKEQDARNDFEKHGPTNRRARENEKGDDELCHDYGRRGPRTERSTSNGMIKRRHNAQNERRRNYGI